MKISVITPAYNSGKWIERAILSVINQNYSNFEHIIIDGGSKDETIDILKKHKHLNWISEPDKGQSDAMNKGFALATGDLIVYLNADDWFESKVFQYVNDYFERNELTQILIGNLYFRYEANPLLLKLKIPAYSFSEIIKPFKYQFPYNPVSYFYRKEVQDSIKGFPLEDHFAMDYWFLLRVFDKYTTSKSELVFGNFFFTGNNKTATTKTNITLMSLNYLKDTKKYNQYIHVILSYTLFLNKELLRNIFLPIFKSAFLVLSLKFISPSKIKENGYRYYK